MALDPKSFECCAAYNYWEEAAAKLVPLLIRLILIFVYVLSPVVLLMIMLMCLEKEIWGVGREDWPDCTLDLSSVWWMADGSGIETIASGSVVVFVLIC